MHNGYCQLTIPKCKRLHSVLAFASKPPKVQKGDKDFVQVLHVGGNHWLTVTNIGCQENRTKVFDSLCQKLSKKEKQLKILFVFGSATACFDSIDGRTPPRWSSTSLIWFPDCSGSFKRSCIINTNCFDGFHQARC